MIDDFDAIVARTGALLGDPQNKWATANYLAPYIDQEYDEMDTQLQAIGMQYTEGIAILTIPENTSDLSSYMNAGQPLQYMKNPKEIRWKEPSMPDLYFTESTGPVDELNEVDITSIGAIQWRFGDGAIQVTPSAIPITLKIFYNKTSTLLVDETGKVIMGTGYILALRVAIFVTDLRGNPKRLVTLQKKHTNAWMAFCVVVTKARQSVPNINPQMHPKRIASSVYLPASSSGTT